MGKGEGHCITIFRVAKFFSIAFELFFANMSDHLTKEDMERVLQNNTRDEIRWTCAACTFDNAHAMPRCEICSTKRPVIVDRVCALQKCTEDESKRQSDSARRDAGQHPDNLLKISTRNGVVVVHHPDGYSQFSNGLTNSCALLAIEIACAALTTNCLSWGDINDILQNAVNPRENQQVSDAIDRGALKERVRIQTEIIKGSGWMGCTNGTLGDVMSSLERGGQNAVAAIITTGGATFTVFRIGGMYFVVDTHAFDGKGMVVKVGYSFEDVVVAHAKLVSTSIAKGMFSEALEYVALAPAQTPVNPPRAQPLAKPQGQPSEDAEAEELRHEQKHDMEGIDSSIEVAKASEASAPVATNSLAFFNKATNSWKTLQMDPSKWTCLDKPVLNTGNATIRISGNDFLDDLARRWQYHDPSLNLKRTLRELSELNPESHRDSFNKTVDSIRRLV